MQIRIVNHKVPTYPIKHATLLICYSSKIQCLLTGDQLN